MTKHQDYIFVLWGQQFDEAAAAIFVTELRELGLRVKMVGLGLRHLRGANGLALLPDFSLDEALALVDRARCVFTPFPSNRLQYLCNDPRLPQFFKQAADQECCFVVGPPVGSAAPDFIPLIDKRLTIYPAREQLVEFTRQLGRQLLMG